MSNTDFSGFPATSEEYKRWWTANTDVPYGFCWCGCGEKTNLALSTRPSKQAVKGEPCRFLRPHYQRFKSAYRAKEREIAPVVKRCVTCCEKKPVAEFYKGTAKQGYKDGYRNQCKACHQEMRHCWYRKNRERVDAYNRAWNRANPEKRREFKGRRRARERDQSVESVDYLAVLDRDGYWCYLCAQAVAPEDVSFDHVMPISKGGPHSMDNIKVTHWECNRRKGNRLL